MNVKQVRAFGTLYMYIKYYGKRGIGPKAQSHLQATEVKSLARIKRYCEYINNMENKRGRIEWKKANIHPMVKFFSTAAGRRKQCRQRKKGK